MNVPLEPALVSADPLEVIIVKLYVVLCTDTCDASTDYKNMNLQGLTLAVSGVDELVVDFGRATSYDVTYRLTDRMPLCTTEASHTILIYLTSI